MTLATIFVVTLGAFMLVTAGMAVGVMLGRREISGSCGGLAARTDATGDTPCSLCTNPDAACKELSRRGRGGSPTKSGIHVQTETESDSCPQDCADSGCDKETINAGNTR